LQERGARYTLIMLDEKQKKIGVIAASAGMSSKHKIIFSYNFLKRGRLVRF
jgi:hypothetical protein